MAAADIDVPHPVPAPRRQLRWPGPGAAVLPGAIAFALLVMVPFGILVAYSLMTPTAFNVSGPLTFDAYTSALSSSVVRDMALNSLKVGAPVALVTVALAVPVAYWLRYAAGRLMAPVLLAITVTFFASYLVRIYAWRTLLGEHGLINQALTGVGVTDKPIEMLFTPFATTLGLVHYLLPLAILLLIGAFRPLEPGYLEVARDLGARGITLWRKVILPAIAAPLVTTFLLMLVLASSDWVTPTLLGGGHAPMLGVRIQEEFKVQGDFPSGAAISVLMLGCYAIVFALAMGGLHWAGLDRLRWIGAAAGAPRRSPGSGAVVALVLVFLYVPLALVVLFSFHSTPSLSWPFTGFSTRWYDALFADQVAMQTLRTSLVIAAEVASITFLLGTLTAFGLSRLRARWRGLLTSAFLLPAALPPLFIGVALLTFFLRTQVELSRTTVIIGHCVQTFPLYLLIVGAAMRRLDPALEEAATDLGASSWQAFRRVTLPQLWPSLLGATALSFAISFDEFAVTVFTVGQESTLPLYVYGRLRQTIDPLINAISTLLMLVTIALLVVTFVVLWTRERRRARSLTEEVQA